MDADVVVVGAGLSGLVAAAELADAGRRVIISTRSPPRLGGQAFWSFGGLMFVDSPNNAGCAYTTPRARLGGLARLGRVRPARRLLASAVG
jgi:predicted oxidoreductase